MITPDQIGFIWDQIVKSRVTKPVITENSKFYFPIFYQRMSLITNILFGPDEDLSPDYPHHPIKPINPNFIFPLSWVQNIMATGWKNFLAKERLSSAILTNQRGPGDRGQRLGAPWCDQLSYKSQTRDNQSQIPTIECDIQGLWERKEELLANKREDQGIRLLVKQNTQ